MGYSYFELFTKELKTLVKALMVLNQDPKKFPSFHIWTLVRPWDLHQHRNKPCLGIYELLSEIFIIPLSEAGDNGEGVGAEGREGKRREAERASERQRERGVWHFMLIYRWLEFQKFVVILYPYE